MFPESLELVIVTPERQLLREGVVEAVLPGANGQLGVLPGHAPLITELGIGELTYRSANANHTGVLAIVRGFAEVLADRVTVLAEVAERAEEIDLARAQAALKRAEEHLAARAEDIDWERANAALQRALVRIRVAEYMKHRRGAPVSTH
jgi:F-type H+-transporting ATPase subunit epsilon